jgi:hypothetical protein
VSQVGLGCNGLLSIHVQAKRPNVGPFERMQCWAPCRRQPPGGVELRLLRRRQDVRRVMKLDGSGWVVV